MKRLVRFAARLYPASWRERYGAEFDALLEDSHADWRTSLDVLRGALGMNMRTWSVERIMLVAGMAGTLIAWSVSYSLPGRYKSDTVAAFTGLDTADARSKFLSTLTQTLKTSEYARNDDISIVSAVDRTVFLKIGRSQREPLSTWAIDADLLSRVEDTEKVTGIALYLWSPSKPTLIVPDHSSIALTGLAAGVLLGLLIALVRRSPKHA